MRFKGQQQWAVITAFTVFWMFSTPGGAAAQVRAQEHVVSPGELHRQIASASQARATNIGDIERVLSLPAAQDTLRKANLDQQKLHKAVSLLSDAEVSRLAEKARAAEKDVEGGLIVGLLALIGLVVVVLVVIAVVNKSDD